VNSYNQSSGLVGERKEKTAEASQVGREVVPVIVLKIEGCKSGSESKEGQRANVLHKLTEGLISGNEGFYTTRKKKRKGGGGVGGGRGGGV